MKLSKFQFWLLVGFTAILIFIFINRIPFETEQPAAQSASEKSKPPTLIPTTPPQDIEETKKKDQQDPEAKQILENQQKRGSQVEPFLTTFFNNFYQYDAKKPTAHVERVKNNLDPSLYEMLKAQYKEPFSDTKKMEFRDFKIESRTTEDTQDIRLELIAHITFTGSDNKAVTEPQFISILLKPNGDTWKVRWLESANAAD
ncbi:hypothetical protein SAMN04487866_10720 [Thermoactinomyces sp. DSM 45891]|uniref:hypothetical protein n=1 Tax=Thermoactinomyces sp. DSM 45891 TaxID=1761907 RepID=UPI0009148518|nr:hypothetical protein [Thermoactinomyces sp. DSM 45891]SFX41518.1 hypothetical protein SAMN04487866_10720 [Thermoactinomyces sp. DSM 45891]